MPLDYDRDQDIIHRVNTPGRRKRAMQELQGIARAVCFDATLTESEFDMITRFLFDQAEFRADWPLSLIWEKVEAILADGVVSEDERILLLQVLREFAAHDHERTQRATEAIFDDEVELLFAQRSFILTGVLEYSKRKPFEERLEKLGGTIHSSVRRDTHFVIVGMKGSESWTTDRYGSKIDKAMQIKRETPSCGLKIVREMTAVEALLRAERAMLST